MKISCVGCKQHGVIKEQGGWVCGWEKQLGAAESCGTKMDWCCLAIMGVFSSNGKG